MEKIYHTPAVLYPCMVGLHIDPNGTYVDVTFGGGGHSKEILNRLGSKVRLLSFDQDEDAMQNIIDDKRFTFVHSNFKYLTNFLKFHNVNKVDGVLADLGVSFHHFDDSQRGFSFRFNGELDMRMNKQAKIKASTLIETYSETQIVRAQG